MESDELRLQQLAAQLGMDVSDFAPPSPQEIAVREQADFQEGVRLAAEQMLLLNVRAGFKQSVYRVAACVAIAGTEIRNVPISRQTALEVPTVRSALRVLHHGLGPTGRPLVRTGESNAPWLISRRVGYDSLSPQLRGEHSFYKSTPALDYAVKRPHIFPLLAEAIEYVKR